jgi:hypothetical protein
MFTIIALKIETGVFVGPGTYKWLRPAIAYLPLSVFKKCNVGKVKFELRKSVFPKAANHPIVAGNRQAPVALA